MAEATIDSLRIDIEASSAQAADGLEKLIQKLERLRPAVSAVADNGSLNKLKNQLNKLSQVAQKLNSLSGFDKITQLVNSLQSLNQLNSVNSQAINKVSRSVDKLSEVVNKINAIPALSDTGNLDRLQEQMNRLATVMERVQNVSGFSKITDFIKAIRSLGSLNNVNMSNLNAIIAFVHNFQSVVNQVNAMPNIDVSKFQQLAAAMQPFSGTDTRGFAVFLRTLQKLPEIADKLDSMDFGRFADQMQRLANSIMPVARQLREATQAFNHMPRGWSRYISDATAASAASDRTSRSVGGLNTTLGNLRLRTAAAIAFMRRLVDVLGSAVVKSNQFVENLNLFTVTMGESADEAYKFAEAVNDAMGIDVSDWVRYQGFFQSIGKGFGIASDKADLMSQNLTQLSYDLSSFYNTSVDEAYNKVVSGISGELEPLVLAA